jgi:type VI secretion system protein ImpF
MKAEGFSRDKLQPALIDRLLDNYPNRKAPEPIEERIINRKDLRNSILRDLSWLLNTNSPLNTIDHNRYTQVGSSVLNYGVPPFSGTLVSKAELPELEQRIRQAVINFEPRIIPSTLSVRSFEPEDPMAHHNQLVFEIRAEMWAQPFPIELILRTSMDMESGLAKIADVGP